MRVRYTLTAARQIEAAVDHLAAQSPQAARGLQYRLSSVLALLQAFPKTGRVVRAPHIRRFPLGTYPYLLDYSATDDEIIVRRFRHASRRTLA